MTHSQPATEESGPGSAINATARQFGAVLTTAVTGIILGNSAVTGTASRLYTTLRVAVIAVAVAVAVLGISPSRRTAAAGGLGQEQTGRLTVP